MQAERLVQHAQNTVLISFDNLPYYTLTIELFVLHSPSSAQNGNRKKRQSQPVSLVVIFKVFFIIVYTYNKYRKRKRTVNSAAISAVVDFTYVNNRQFFQSLAQVNVEFPRRNLLRSASMYDGPMVCNHYNTTAYPINFWNSMFFTWWASKLSCSLTHYRTYLYPEYTLLHSEKNIVRKK